MNDQRWVPCSEKKPPENGYYICTICDELGKEVKVEYYFSDNPYWENYVTAWMPLPEIEPYMQETEKEKKKEKEKGSLTQVAREHFMRRFMRRE